MGVAMVIRADVVWPVQKGNSGILRCTGQVEMGSNGLVGTKKLQKM